MIFRTDEREYDTDGLVRLGVSTPSRGGVRVKEMYFDPKRKHILRHVVSYGFGEGFAIAAPGDKTWADQVRFAFRYGRWGQRGMLAAALEEFAPGEPLEMCETAEVADE